MNRDLAGGIERVIKLLEPHSDRYLLEQASTVLKLRNRCSDHVLHRVLRELGWDYVKRVLDGQIENEELSKTDSVDQSALRNIGFTRKQQPLEYRAAVFDTDSSDLMDAFRRNLPLATPHMLPDIPGWMLAAMGNPDDRQRRETTIVFTSKKNLFKALPEAELIASIDRNFSVREHILDRDPRYSTIRPTIIYTEDAKRIIMNPQQLCSNLMHEAEVHTVTSLLDGTIILDGKTYQLNYSLLVPKFLFEGMTNEIIRRYRVRVPQLEGDTFLDMFAKSWDGRIPSFNDILAGTQDYFFNTILSALYFQDIGLGGAIGSYDESMSERGILNFDLLATQRQFDITGRKGDIQAYVLESIYEEMTGRPLRSLKERYDRFRREYASQYLSGTGYMLGGNGLVKTDQ